MAFEFDPRPALEANAITVGVGLAGLGLVWVKYTDALEEYQDIRFREMSTGMNWEHRRRGTGDEHRRSREVGSTGEARQGCTGSMENDPLGSRP